MDKLLAKVEVHTGTVQFDIPLVILLNIILFCFSWLRFYKMWLHFHDHKYWKIQKRRQRKIITQRLLVKTIQL